MIQIPQLPSSPRGLFQEAMLPPKHRAMEKLADCWLCKHVIYKYTDWTLTFTGSTGNRAICAMCNPERKV